MGVLLKKRNGKFLPNWYGELIEEGHRRIVNLAIRWAGKPVESLRDEGDPVFEATRKAAKEELEKQQIKWREKGRAEHLTERLIEAKTGRKLEYVKLAELAAKWRNIGRETQPGEPWLKWCDTVFARFAADVPCTYLHEVTPEQATLYSASLKKEFSRKTARGVTQLLKSAFARLLPLGTSNPFAGGIVRKSVNAEGDTVHRRPFTAVELTRLFDAASADAFLYPLVVTAACTGLRRGDVCRLRWRDIDLHHNVVAIKTSKTGASVEIPIFRPLREVLEAALAERAKGAEYVYPSAARMLEENNTGVTWRFKKLVASVMRDSVPVEDVEAITEGKSEQREVLADVLKEVVEAVSQSLDGERLHRTVETLRLYSVNKSVRKTAEATGRSKSTISTDLHRAEELSGKCFMPDMARGEGVKVLVDRVTRSGDLERKAGDKGKRKPKGRTRRASVLDWHALRVTWVTLALSAGVPMEVARLVTGHKTVEVVLKHYFKPGREHLRAVLGDKLPDVLTGGERSSKVGEMTVEELAAKVAAKTASEEERKRLGELLRG